MQREDAKTATALKSYAWKYGTSSVMIIDALPEPVSDSSNIPASVWGEAKETSETRIQYNRGGVPLLLTHS
jgi:hypothetical protein